ncbi:hypothetical protein D3C78_1231660 [compost metagenome]
MRHADHQASAGRHEGLADQRLPGGHGFPGAVAVDHAALFGQRSRRDRQQAAVGANHVGRVEDTGLGLEPLGFRRQLLRLIEDRGQHGHAVGQLLAGQVQQAFGAVRQLGRIHPVGFQGLADQQVALGQIAGIEGVRQCEQGRGHRKQQYQAAQIEPEHGGEVHVATPPVLFCEVFRKS